MGLEQWKVEVAEAEIEESFGSESEATARFEELVAQRHDDEIVKLYQIGSGGMQISHRTERGRQKVSYATHHKPDDLLDRRAFSDNLHLVGDVGLVGFWQEPIRCCMGQALCSRTSAQRLITR